MAASRPRESAPRGFSTARAFAIAGGLIVAVTLFDQASKSFVIDYFMRQPQAIAVTGFFNLALSFNTGISFGIFRGGADWVRWVLILAGFGIMAVLLDWLRREPGRTLSLAIGLICGGALGNIIDRIRLGAVVDFLDFYLGAWHWPAFNFADTAIVLGVLGLILDGLFQPPSSSKE
jgi:signal peptidase II